MLESVNSTIKSHCSFIILNRTAQMCNMEEQKTAVESTVCIQLYFAAKSEKKINIFFIILTGVDKHSESSVSSEWKLISLS